MVITSHCRPGQDVASRAGWCFLTCKCDTNVSVYNRTENMLHIYIYMYCMFASIYIYIYAYIYVYTHTCTYEVHGTGPYVVEKPAKPACPGLGGASFSSASPPRLGSAAPGLSASQAHVYIYAYIHNITYAFVSASTACACLYMYNNYKTHTHDFGT